MAGDYVDILMPDTTTISFTESSNTATVFQMKTLNFHKIPAFIIPILQLVKSQG